MSRQPKAIQNETFYVKKRGLFRKAEQVVRSCNSDVYIIVHHKDSDKIFSFTSHPGFTLEKISTLVLRDVQQGASLKKNKQYEDTDFLLVKRNVEEMDRINKQFAQSKESPAQLIEDMNNQDLLSGRGGVEPTENDTQTEDMSMSMQQNYKEGRSPIPQYNNESSNGNTFSPRAAKKAKQLRAEKPDNRVYPQASEPKRQAEISRITNVVHGTQQFHQPPPNQNFTPRQYAQPVYHAEQYREP